MQVILGAGGDIGTLLARELKAFTNQVRLVARQPRQVNGDDELFPADLLDAEKVLEAVAGADVAYLVAGLKYDRRIWARQWPVIMRNVIDACLKHGTKLVFFDNVYLYDQTAIPHMTEASPANPPSQKGHIRLQLVQMVNAAIADHGLQALIARCADFYGPGAKNGILNMLVLTDVARGKKAKWQANVEKVHSFTYTPDAAKATAMLGNEPGAYGQVWHLPTSPERLTGRDLIELTAGAMGSRPGYTVLTPLLLSLAGLFDRTIKELVEMQYQNDRDYFFDSSKFCEAFKFTPTRYEAGIRAVLATEAASARPQ